MHNVRMAHGDKPTEDCAVPLYSAALHGIY